MPFSNDREKPDEYKSDSERHRMDSKTADKIDYLYRNCRNMPLITVFSVLFPVILIFAALLGMLYAFDRRKLLKKIDSNQIELPDPASEPYEKELILKVDYLRDHGLWLWLPMILFAVFSVAVILFMAVVVTSQ